MNWAPGNPDDGSMLKAGSGAGALQEKNIQIWSQSNLFFTETTMGFSGTCEQLPSRVLWPQCFSYRKSLMGLVESISRPLRACLLYRVPNPTIRLNFSGVGFRTPCIRT